MRTRFAGFAGQDVHLLYAFLNQSELVNLPAISRLEQYGPRDFIGWFAGDQLRSVFQVGANLMPIATTSQAREEFALTVVPQGRRCASIVGLRSEVQALWQLLEPEWGPAREVRIRQPYLALSEDKLRQARLSSLQVQVATLADFAQLLPAAIEMFTSELGVSPVHEGSDVAYRTRLASQVEHDQVFVAYIGDELVFKCEIGASSASAVLLQGVWVAKALRNQGIATAALSAVATHIFDAGVLQICLYVNDFNAPALATYQKLGFEAVADYQSVLF